MRALPIDPADHEVPTGLTCPECFGSLAVAREGDHGTLRFRCRTGHAYAAEEVLVGKERRVDEYLGAALTALDELRAFLEDLATRGDIRPHVDYEDRIRRAKEQAATIRALIEGNTPIALAPGSAPDAGTS
jgi:two-component system chemotaxis response regulator CheB